MQTSSLISPKTHSSTVTGVERMIEQSQCRKPVVSGFVSCRCITANVLQTKVDAQFDKRATELS